MTPPLEVPMDSLDQIRPEHMTLSAELPDFEGNQEVMSTQNVPPSPPVTHEDPQVGVKKTIEQPPSTIIDARKNKPVVEEERPMMAQASTSSTFKFDMQAWTEGLCHTM